MHHRLNCCGASQVVLRSCTVASHWAGAFISLPFPAATPQHVLCNMYQLPQSCPAAARAGLRASTGSSICWPDCSSQQDRTAWGAACCTAVLPAVMRVENCLSMLRCGELGAGFTSRRPACGCSSCAHPAQHNSQQSLSAEQTGSLDLRRHPTLTYLSQIKGAVTRKQNVWRLSLKLAQCCCGCVQNRDWTSTETKHVNDHGTNNRIT